MNQEARDKLVEAALNGTKQTFGTFAYKNSKCAMGALGVLEDGSNALQIRQMYDLNKRACPCPFIGTKQEKYGCHYFQPGSLYNLKEFFLVMHLNDGHRLSFLDIARKFPESSE